MTANEISQRPASVAESGDVLLANVLESYLADVESGRAPSTAELIAKYPELADRLEKCLASLRFVEQAGVDIRSTTLAEPLAEEGATLGDFRIVREIGRGGMGIVYEAEQQSLRRRVALKILPFAAVLDDRRLQRFKNEALAAAQLKHPNIVSVLSVGCERGVHYYAMEYVEGQSLAEVVEQLRISDCGLRIGESENVASSQPAIRNQSEINTEPIAALSTLHAPGRVPSGQLHAASARERFRQIARLGIQAAEALHFAHEIGIVHRDIKPSNLLVDAHGHLWITDFGLATTQTDAGLTITGDLLGTLRYMSPEQAVGDRARMDYRTDIYSLGVTLYELLTGQPAFPDTDRRVLLCRIAEDHPKPLRAIDPAIPRDLETIVLKATEKEPHARYDSAAELAADLQRHLSHEPIQACRPSKTYRLQRFVRKYRWTVAAAVTIFALLNLALALALVGLIKINRERQVTKAERDRAAHNLRLAQRLIGEVVAPASDRLEFVSGGGSVQQVKAELLKQAIAFYERVIEQTPHDPNARLELARLCNRVAGPAFLAGEDDEVFCRRSISILTQLVAEFPDEPSYRQALAESYEGMAQLDWGQLRWKDSSEHYRAALTILENLVEKYANEPKYRDQLVKTNGWLAYPLQHSGELADAEIHYRTGLQNRSIAGVATRQRFANLLISQNRFADAKRQLEEALRLAEEQIPGSDWGSALKGFWTSIILNELGMHCICVSKPEEAVVFLNRSVDIGEKLSQIVPHSAFQANVCGWSYHHLSEALAQSGQFKEAEQMMRQAFQTWRSASGRMRSHNVALAYFRLGDLLHLDGRMEEARSNFRLANELLERISRELPDEQYCQKRLILLLAHCPDHEFRDPQWAASIAKHVITDSNGPMWRYLALSQYRAGVWHEARKSLQTSIQLRQGGDAMDWLMLAMIHWQLNHRSEAVQWHARAQEAISSGQPIFYGEIGVLGFKRLLAEAGTTLGGGQQ